MTTIIGLALLGIIGIGALWIVDLLRWCRRTDRTLAMMAASISELQSQAIGLEAAEAETRLCLLWTVGRLADRGILDETDAPIINAADVRH
jgi:hypothetical protein